MSLDELLELSQALGHPDLDAAILAEGNASCRANQESFWIKASGKNLRTLGELDCCRVLFAPILDSLVGPALNDEEVKSTLRASVAESNQSLLPSVETFMHAFLLGLPGVEFVGHTHPTSLLSILCLENAIEFAKRRVFPDEIVCCGPESVFVGYEDPGLPLARVMRESVMQYLERRGEAPKTIWMQNHGFIALGATAAEVEASTKMAVKAARVVLGSLQSGLPVRWLSEEEVSRIHRRPDEHYRQRLLWQK